MPSILNVHDVKCRTVQQQTTPS